MGASEASSTFQTIGLVTLRRLWPVNRKRVQRLYREEGSAVRRRAGKRRSETPRLVRQGLSGRDERWSMDFMTDTLSSGRRFRCLNIIDEFSRECLAIHLAHSIPAVRVIEVLECVREERGLPSVITSATLMSAEESISAAANLNSRGILEMRL
jgi:putative transposase